MAVKTVVWSAVELLRLAKSAKVILTKRVIFNEKFQLMKLQEVFVKKIRIVYLGLFVLALAGCSRCEECKLQGSSETVCETEFDSSLQYENAIADLESQGATCTASGGF